MPHLSKQVQCMVRKMFRFFIISRLHHFNGCKFNDVFTVIVSSNNKLFEEAVTTNHLITTCVWVGIPSSTGTISNINILYHYINFLGLLPIKIIHRFFLKFFNVSFKFLKCDNNF